MVLEHPLLPFLVAALVVAVSSRRVGVIAMVAAPAVALLQLRGLDAGSPWVIDAFGYELTPLRYDDLSSPFAYIFVVAGLLSAVFGATTLTRVERVAAMAYVGFGLGVVLAGDLMSLFVMWEVKAVGAAVIIAAGGRAAAGPAALRYLVVHVVGGSLLLGGIAWHLAGGGSIAFDDLGGATAAPLILLAFLLGAAMPPLHAWLPDAYPAASVAGTVFLSIVTTKSAVYALLRGFTGTEALVWIGIAMALYGVVYAVLENDVRRLLSYHIVSQVGFMVTGVGIGTTAAVNGATAHAFAHILYKGLLLMGVGALIHATGRQKLTELGGVVRSMPWVFGLYMVGALSIAGVPLFSGFVTKEMTVAAASGEGREVVVHLLKLASVGTFLSVALKLPWFAWGGRDRGVRTVAVPPTMVVAMTLTAAANVVIGLRPDVLYDLLPHAVDHQPFAAARLSDTIQLLTFAGLAFWLLVDRLGAKATVTLDTDWLYRVAPGRVATVAGPRIRPVAVMSRRRIRRTVRPARKRLGAVLGPSLDRPGVPPTIALGLVTLGALVLALSVAVIA